MNTLHLVRPELRRFLAEFPVPKVTQDTFRLIRENAVPPVLPAEDPGLEVTERIVPGPKGEPEVRVVVYRPIGITDAMPAILHIHGGGYVFGAPEGDDEPNRKLCRDLGCVVVSVDYRLSPETAFPGPLEDCYAALAWLSANAAALNVDAGRIAVKGESAGGGLAAGLALLARDRAEIPLLYQCLTYPMIDDRAVHDPHPWTGEFVWYRESNHFGWSAYLGTEPGGPGVSPYAAPARADDLAGLPPTLIVAGALDLFLEEDLEYARRLTRAGVPVELIVYPGVYHGFPMAGETELMRRYERDTAEALRSALAR